MGYPAKLRYRVIQRYREGTGIRAIGRRLHVNHQHVTNWINAHAAPLPQDVTDFTPTNTIEINEVHTFVGQKKSYITSVRDSGGQLPSPPTVD